MAMYRHAQRRMTSVSLPLAVRAARICLAALFFGSFGDSEGAAPRSGQATDMREGLLEEDSLAARHLLLYQRR
jgi:hypothetical protein